MTPQERVIAALSFQPPDRVPLFDTYWEEFVARWRRQKGLPESADIAAHYGVDIAIAIGDETPWPSRAEVLREDASGRVEREGWGRIVRTVPGAHFFDRLEPAIPERVDPDRLVFDPPDLESRYQGFAENVARWKRQFAVFAKTGGPFLRTCFMRGEENFLMDVAEDPAYACALAGRVADHLIAIGLEELRRGDLGDTGLWIYDDMASNAAPMMSPRSWEQVLLPHYRRMVRAFKQQGGARFVVLHCDGNLMPILDMLVDAGIDGLNPVERKAGMDPRAIRERFGKRLAIVGGICNAQVLPRGDPAEIEAHLRDLLALAREGGLVAGSHSIGDDISVAAYDHFVQTLRRLGDYPLRSV